MDKLKEILTDSLAETNILLSSKTSTEAIDIINKVYNIINGKDPLQINSIDPTELFYAGLYLFNESDYTNEDIKEMTEKARRIVKSWTYDEHYDSLIFLFENINMDKSFKNSLCIKH